MTHITPLPAFDDNYIWLLRPPDGTGVAVVDPGDEVPVLEALARAGLTLSAILITHHHGDHTGGVADLIAAYPGVQVLGPKDPRIQGITQALGEGDEVRLPGFPEPLRVMEVPGHTASHIAYRWGDALFCGDTLFAGGCGRVFDGTFEQLSASLLRIAALPPDTQVYCAHEYTLANLGFAKWVEPDSPALAERVRDAQGLRAWGRPRSHRSWPWSWPPTPFCAPVSQASSPPPRAMPAAPCTATPRSLPPCASGKTGSMTSRFAKR